MTETPNPDDVAIHEETSNSLFADDRNYYRIEKWTKDGSKIDCSLYERLAAPREVVDMLFKEHRSLNSQWRDVCMRCRKSEPASRAPTTGNRTVAPPQPSRVEDFEIGKR
jgi:hypothetical protein